MTSERRLKTSARLQVIALAYTWTPEERALVARYYEDIPRGFFLYNAGGHTFTSQWQYEGRPEGRPSN